MAIAKSKIPNLYLLASRSITSLLSIILASVVLQRVEFTTVAVYPARAAQMAISLIPVVLFLFRTRAEVGRKMPKKVAYVQRVI